MKNGAMTANELDYLLLTAARRRMALNAPGPVPVGGLRIPSSNSLSTRALLCVSFFEAKSSVRRFLLWAS